MSKVIPAILSDSLDDYIRLLGSFEELDSNEKVHLDIMDGEFVDSKSCELDTVLKLQTTLKRQVHLMVVNPKEFVELCVKYGVEEVAFHYEALRGDDDWRNFEESKIQRLLAINPQTSCDEITEYLDYFDGVLIMTVNPGKQGGKFLPECLDKGVYLRRGLGYRGRIVYDGGINIETIKSVLKAYADELVVGSAIAKSGNIKNSYNELNTLCK